MIVTQEIRDALRAELEHARCRRSRVAAVLVRDGVVIAAGHNAVVVGASCLDGGCPRGQLDYDQAPLGTPSAGPAKCRGVHAELMTCLRAASKGIPTAGASLAVTRPMCHTCGQYVHVANIEDVQVVTL